MGHKRKGGKPLENAATTDAGRESEVRIIGGHFRGRRLRYHGDPVVRPMKHRVREAMFNLISTESKDHYVIDVFAGTGALGLEALSRGAVGVTFIERHVPSSRVVEENIATLGVGDRVKLLVTSAFVWSKRDLGTTDDSPPTDRPWLVFCSPPYDFFIERRDEMLELIHRLAELAPAESVIVVEADGRFDFKSLVEGSVGTWDIREYPPAVVGIWRLGKVDLSQRR